MRYFFYDQKILGKIVFLTRLKLLAILTVNIGMPLIGARGELNIFYGFQQYLLIYFRVEVNVVRIQNSIIKYYGTPRVWTKHGNDHVPDLQRYNSLADFESESDTPPDKKYMKSV